MRLLGTIRRRTQPGVYLIIDRSGRAHRAESQAQYNAGQSVTVLDGQIVGLAPPAPRTTTYEV